MSIFVSIACFMDKDIINTIEDCLKKAKNPNQIVFGICLQYDKNDDFLKKYDNNPQFKIHRMDWKTAKGPTYARYLISKLINNEDYFLQIDCHTRFFVNWDEIAITCLKECNDNKSILTAFPVAIENMNNPSKCIMNKSTSKFQNLSLESIKLGSETCSNNKIEKTYYLSAACLFGPCRFVKQVKFDPILTYAYQTIEQQFYAIRLFTYGWNLYAPKQHFVATYYRKMDHFDSKGTRVYAPSNISRGKHSWDRVLFYYGLKDISNIEECVREDINKYGFGNERSLQDFFTLHNEKDCIQKLKDGKIYNNKSHTWNTTYYFCNNPIINELLKSHNNFIKTNNEANADFFYNIQPKHTNYKLQFYPMNNVSFIDNKKESFLLFEKHNLRSGIPKTYFDVNNITSFNGNLYLKYAGNNGGKNVFIFDNLIDIKSHLNKSRGPYVIQEEIINPLLINEKKFVLRNWIIIVDNSYYITTNGICIIHGTNYNVNSLDRNIHIDHDEKKITYKDFNKQHFYEQSLQKIILLSENICNVLNTKHRHLNNCFQILGMDFIINKNMNPYLVEINSWPSLHVPYEIIKEFFSNFLTFIIIPKMQNQSIKETSYFKKLNLNSQLYNTNNIQSTIFTRNEPKILILILSSNGVYEETNKLSEQTWLKEITNYKNMQYFFYYGKNNSNSKDPNKIFTNNDETRNKILNKTIDVFKYVNKNIEFDYILRLCACSYVDLKKLNNFVKTLENTKIFSGPFNNTSEGADKRYNLKREPFITGANMLLSKDVVDFIIKNETLLDYAKYGHADDLNISMIINSHYILKSQWLNQAWININDTSINYCEQLKNNNFYHYHYNHNKFKHLILEFHKNYTFNT